MLPIESGSIEVRTAGQPGSRFREARVLELAAGQHGVVTRIQLLELGLSSAAIGRRLKAVSLRRLHAGVYLVGPIEPERAAEMAAVLAGGPAAVLSHTSALHLWSLHRTARVRPIHVSVVGNGRGRRAGIVFHRVGGLAHDEVTVVDGIRVTSPGRTIVDAAAMLDNRELERAVAEAEREGLIPQGELARLPARYSRRPGIASLRQLLGEEPGPRFTRSEAERRCRDLLRSAGLPPPHSNVPVGPYELDLFWPKEGIAIEIDGYAHHASRGRFEGDRRKDNWLRARGIEVIRLTWRQITRRPLATAVQVGQILALTSARRSRSTVSGDDTSPTTVWQGRGGRHGEGDPQAHSG